MFDRISFQILKQQKHRMTGCSKADASIYPGGNFSDNCKTDENGRETNNEFIV